MNKEKIEKIQEIEAELRRHIGRVFAHEEFSEAMGMTVLSMLFVSAARHIAKMDTEDFRECLSVMLRDFITHMKLEDCDGSI